MPRKPSAAVRMQLRILFGALPAYAGGKQKLTAKIFTQIAHIIPCRAWPDLTFIDLFMGAGSVSLYAKAQGFGRLVSNDWSHRSSIVAQAIIANNRVRLSEDDYRRLLLPTDVPTDQGFIYANFARTVFSRVHAQFLDTLQQNTDAVQDPTKRALCRLLLWHLVLDFVSFGTSVGSSNRPMAEVLDGIRAWWELNPKRFTDRSMARLTKAPVLVGEHKLAKVNASIFAAAGAVEVYQRDALQLIESVQGDIVYLDPPYPETLSYEKANQVLDAILQGNVIDRSPEVSPFSQGVEALANLLGKAGHIPVWAISYGNKVIDKDGLLKLVQGVAPQRKVVGWAWPYIHFGHVTKRTDNQELFVLAVDEIALNQRLKTLGGNA
jgi:16S rRNA G966 N2-methylase RsmD